MNVEEMALRITEHDGEIRELKHRMEKQEDHAKIFQELVLTVRELVVNTNHIMDEVQRQRKSIERFGERLEKLENIPAEKWKSTSKTVAASVISTIMGAVVAAALVLVIQAMQYQL